MNFGIYQVLGNRHGITVYRNTTVNTHWETVKVPASFISLHWTAYTVQRFTLTRLQFDGKYRIRRI